MLALNLGFRELIPINKDKQIFYKINFIIKDHWKIRSFVENDKIPDNKNIIDGVKTPPFIKQILTFHPS